MALVKLKYTPLKVMKLEMENKKQLEAFLIDDISSIMVLLKYGTGYNEEETSDYLEELKEEYGSYREVFFKIVEHLEEKGFLREGITKKHVMAFVENRGKAMVKELEGQTQPNFEEILKMLQKPKNTGTNGGKVTKEKSSQEVSAEPITGN